MSFDLDYLMKQVIFEFAVVTESSLAEQMYMDLNSKNVLLTPFENYKAELVYYLSTRFENEFDTSWKYQLDNVFLNKCYEESEGWKKTLADEAEKLEMKIIHWCFKMACMEFGISIGEIDDTAERLRWMKDASAQTIVQIVGTILNHKIFTEDSNYKNEVEKIIKTNNKIDEFTLKEFNLWFDLRYTKKQSNKYKLKYKAASPC